MRMNLWMMAVPRLSRRGLPGRWAAWLGAGLLAAASATMAADPKVQPVQQQAPAQTVRPAIKNAPLADNKPAKPPVKEAKPKVVKPVVITTPALYLRAADGAAKATPVTITTLPLYLHADPKGSQK